MGFDERKEDDVHITGKGIDIVVAVAEQYRVLLGSSS
jgi:hypothetical protein